jgi:hypothetical protein
MRHNQVSHKLLRRGKEKPREEGALGEKTGPRAFARALAQEVLHKTNFHESKGNVKAPDGDRNLA